MAFFVFAISPQRGRVGLFREGMTPVVRSSSRPWWERLPQRNVFFLRSSRHNMDPILSFVFEFDQASDEEYFFAYSPPYTDSDLQRDLDRLEQVRSTLSRNPKRRY